jgi:hypothetical protein
MWNRGKVSRKIVAVMKWTLLKIVFIEKDKTKWEKVKRKKGVHTLDADEKIF